jgi:hypothetical protein
VESIAVVDARSGQLFQPSIDARELDPECPERHP